MLHKLAMGHFDVEAMNDHRLVVMRPLDMDVVTRLLREVGDVDDDGRARLGGHAVEFKVGYIVCPWIMPEWVEVTEEFARRLCHETGCVKFDVGRREVVPIDRLGSTW